MDIPLPTDSRHLAGEQLASHHRITDAKMIPERIDIVEPTSEEAILHVNVLCCDIGTVKYQSHARNLQELR